MRRVIRRLLTLPLTRPATPGGPAAALRLQRLEDRTVPATFVVTNTSDSGAGSLRQAIASANADLIPDTITFSPLFSTPQTISVASSLSIAGPVSVAGPGAANLTVQNVAPTNGAGRVFDTFGAAGAAVQISGVRITGGSLPSGYGGGGIGIGDEDVTLTGVTLEGNSSGGGGAVFVAGSAGRLTLNSSTVSGNTSSGLGGGIYVTYYASLILNDTTISGNVADGGGGGVLLAPGATLVADGCTISGNSTAGPGGGVYAAPDVAVELNDSTVSGNVAAGPGGGVYFFNGGALVVERSTFSGNAAGTDLTTAAGGGVYFFGTPDASRGGFVISNSTFSGNRSTDAAGVGGGLALESFASPGGTIRNSTFTLNTSANSGGGVAVNSGAGVLSIVSTIVAQNQAVAFPDVYSPATSQLVTASDSLIGDQAGLALSGTGNLSGNAKLGPLQNNGGPTATHALLAGSPALDAGSDPASLGTDQRGGPRVFGGVADVGAFEFATPAVVSFTLTTPSPTNGPAAAYAVRFGQPVAGLTAANFTLAATGTAAGTLGMPTTADGGYTWTVPVTGLGGEGSLQLTFDTVAGLTPAVPGTFPLAGPVLVVDRVAPTATVTRVGPPVTNAASLTFTVTFSEPVVGLTVANFAVTGSLGATIDSISPATGTGTTFDVVVTPGDDGLLELDLVNSGGLTDASGLNPVATPVAGPAVTVDRTRPRVVSITRTGAASTNAAAVGWTVTLSEPVTGLSAANFTLAATGLTGASITGFTGSGETYAVTASAGTGEGTLRLDLSATAGPADAAGNTLLAPLQGQAYTVDRTPPAVTAFTLGRPTPTNAPTLTWTVTFSEAVTPLTAADFTLVATGVTGATITGVTRVGTTYTVAVDSGTGSGTLGLNFVSPTAVADLAGNPLPAPPAGPVYTINRVIPTAAVASVGPPLTNAATVSFTVTFSEPVATLTAANFTITGTGAAGASIASISPSSGMAYTVVVAAGADGTLGLDLANSAGLADLTGLNAVATPVPGGFVTVDRTAPLVSTISRTPPVVTNRAVVTWTVVFSEPVTGVTAASFGLNAVGIAGAAITGVTGSGAAYTVTASTGTGDGTLALTIDRPGGVADAAGNPTPARVFSGSYTIDRTPPVIASFALGRPTPTNAGSLTWTLVFNEPVAGLTAANFAVVAGGGLSGASVTGVGGSGASYTVTVSTGTGSGTLGLNLVTAAAVTDAAGNPLTPSADGPAYAIDRVAPTLALSTPDATRAAGGFPVTARFSKPVAGFGLSAVVVTNGVATNLVAVDASTYTFTVTATNAGPVGVAVGAAAGADAAGNGSLAADPLALTFAPPPITATATTTSPAVTNRPVDYRVEFSAPVAGLTAASVAGAGGTVSNFTAVGPQAYTFTVTPAAPSAVGGEIAAGAGQGAFGLATPRVALPAVAFDNAAPVAAVAPLPGQPTPARAAPVRFAVTFSEPVTGFDLADVTVTGPGSPTATLTGSGASYVVTVTGLAPGAVTVSVAAGAAADAAGNASGAAARAAVAFAPPVDQYLVGAGGGGAALVVNATGAAAGLVAPFAAAPVADDGTSVAAAAVRVATADFTGDGVMDQVVGTGPGGVTLVRVLDGKTGAELFSVQPFEAAFTGGVYVAAGDVDGDGTPDLLVTPDEGGGPRVRVFSGKGFGVMLDFFGIDDPAFRGGARVAVANLPGDGGAEVVVAAGFGGGPRVTVWSGTRLMAAGTAAPPLANFFAFEPGLRNGSYVAAGDVNGDGRADLVFGGGPGGGPRIRVFDGAALFAAAAAGNLASLDGLPDAQLANYFAGDATGVGGARVSLANLDADGRDDLIVGAGPGGGSRVRVYYGRGVAPGVTPALGYEFDAFPGSSLGVYVG